MSESTATTPVDCGHVIRNIWDWLDGELDQGQLLAIREHLAVCVGCRGHMDFAQSFLAHVHEPPREAAEVAVLRTRIRTALRSAGA